MAGSTTDQDYYNQRAGQFKRQLESISQAGMVEADKKGLQGSDQDNYVKDYVANNYSQYYQQEYKNSVTETMKASTGSSQAPRSELPPPPTTHQQSSSSSSTMPPVSNETQPKSDMPPGGKK